MKKKTALVCACVVSAVCGGAGLRADQHEVQSGYPNPLNVYAFQTNTANVPVTATFTGQGYVPRAVQLSMDVDPTVAESDHLDVRVYCTPPAGPSFTLTYYGGDVMARLIPMGTTAVGTWTFLFYDIDDDTMGGIENQLLALHICMLDVAGGTLPCPLADVGMQGGLHGSDGQHDNNDWVVFIDDFFAQDSRSDIGVQGGTVGSDALFDNNDFVVFIDRFFLGC